MTELSKIELDGAYPHLPSDPIELGALMRELRVAAKRDLKDVAQELRIRQPYLEAIEDGRLDDLPGPAYTTGFLRAYSEFLGLDGHAVVERVKEAGLDIDKRASLVLPSPVEDGSLPTSSLLLVAAMLAMAAYAGWYYVWTEDSTVLDRVASMPAELASLTGTQGAAAPPPTAPARLDPVAAPRDAGAAPMESEPAPVAQEPAIIAAAPPAEYPAEPAPSNAQTPTPSMASVDTLPEKSETAAQPDAPAGVAAVKIPVARQPPATPAAPPTQASVTAVRPPVQPATAPSPVQPERGEGPTVAAVGTPPPVAPPAVETRRIRIRATTDSWVEIRDAKDEPLMSKLMNDGDSFDLESRPGLKLVTGNAGGLELFVDAEKVGPLGPMGEILQNVPIDADSLLKR